MKFSLRSWLLPLLLIPGSVLAGAELDVRVKPGNAALEHNIEGHIGTLDDRDELELIRFRPAAEALARRAAEALGYYQSRIRSEIRLDPLRLIIRVDPGEPVRLRRVLIRIQGPGARDQAFRLPQSPHLSPGARLDHGRYEDAKKLIQSRASRYGFFDGRFVRQRLEIDPAAGTADIELVYDSGPRYRLGAVTFSGDTPLKDKLLRRMVPFPPDTPYDSELIAKLQQNLQGSGYFDGVRVDSSPAKATGALLPVDVHLTMRKPRSFGLGAGFSTDIGPRGRANWTRHWFNAGGHSYGAEAQVSSPKINAGLWYDIPLNPPTTDKLRIAGGYQYQQLANSDSNSRLLKFGPEWHSKLDSGWQRVVSLKWQREEYHLGDDNGLSTFLLPGVSYSYLRSDHPLDPSEGYRLQFEVAAAKGGLLSDADLVRGVATLKGLTTLADKHRLLARVQAGGNFTNEYTQIPPSLRFFAGGDQSVRGYSYQTLSPTNSDGDHIGGRYMLAGSLEYQYRLLAKWRLATFIDEGNAFNSLSSPGLKTGVGVGVRWISPVGPVRLDLAHAVQDGGFRVHFSMGPDL